jgi:predicted transport protein
MNHFKTYLFFYLFACSANASELGSETTKFLVTKVFASCKHLPHITNPTVNLEMFYSSYTDELKRNGYRPGSSYNLQNLQQYFTEYACDENLVHEFRKMISHDLRADHVKELHEIKKEIDLFVHKNLVPSAQLAKYLSYRDEHDLTDIEIPSDVLKISESVKISSDKRKASCSDVINLSAPLSLEKPKNQDHSNWCYAYAASDLLAHALGENPSAVYMAQLTNSDLLHSMTGLRSIGFIDVVIKQVQNNGLCLEKDMPSTDYEFTGKRSSLGEIFKQILKLTRDYQQQHMNEEDIAKNLCSENRMLLNFVHEIFPALDAHDLGSILLRGASDDAFKRMVDASCKIVKDDQKLKALEVKNVTGQENIFKTLDEQLNKGNILGIFYKDEVLKNYQDTALIPKHASSIVGRRFNPKNNTCEYLLRNSWGKTCAGLYSEDYECKDGHLWIGEDFFKYDNAINEVIYLDKK